MLTFALSRETLVYAVLTKCIIVEAKPDQVWLSKLKRRIRDRYKTLS